MPASLTPVRVRTTWTRWDARTRRTRTSHPVMWSVTEPDGNERLFDTKSEALAWVAAEYAHLLAGDSLESR